MSVDKTIEELSGTLAQLGVLVEHINAQIAGITSRVNMTLENFDSSVFKIANDAGAMTGQVGNTIAQVPHAWVFYLLFITLIVVLVLLSVLIVINLATRVHAIIRIIRGDPPSRFDSPLPSALFASDAKQPLNLPQYPQSPAASRSRHVALSMESEPRRYGASESYSYAKQPDPGGTAVGQSATYYAASRATAHANPTRDPQRIIRIPPPPTHQCYHLHSSRNNQRNGKPANQIRRIFAESKQNGFIRRMGTDIVAPVDSFMETINDLKVRNSNPDHSKPRRTRTPAEIQVYAYPDPIPDTSEEEETPQPNDLSEPLLFGNSLQFWGQNRGLWFGRNNRRRSPPMPRPRSVAELRPPSASFNSDPTRGIVRLTNCSMIPKHSTPHSSESPQRHESPTAGPPRERLNSIGNIFQFPPATQPKLSTVSLPDRLRNPNRSSIRGAIVLSPGAPAQIHVHSKNGQPVQMDEEMRRALALLVVLGGRVRGDQFGPENGSEAHLRRSSPSNGATSGRPPFPQSRYENTPRPPAYRPNMNASDSV